MTTKTTYQDKLKDPRWQKKRLKILERDNFACQRCSDTTSFLHIHHLKYGKEPWDVSDDDLVTLCECCHFMVEKLQNEGNEIEKIIRVEYPNDNAVAYNVYRFNENGDIIHCFVKFKDENIRHEYSIRRITMETHIKNFQSIDNERQEWMGSSLQANPRSLDLEGC